MPQEFLNELSLVCRIEPGLERAYIGWMRSWDDDEPDRDPRVLPELMLWYGSNQPPTTRFRWRAYTGNVYYRDEPTVNPGSLPDLKISRARDAPIDPEIEKRWLRIY
jgi:hypothetical protein